MTHCYAGERRWWGLCFLRQNCKRQVRLDSNQVYEEHAWFLVCQLHPVHLLPPLVFVVLFENKPPGQPVDCFVDLGGSNAGPVGLPRLPSDLLWYLDTGRI